MADKRPDNEIGIDNIPNDDHSISICFSTTDGLLSKMIRSASNSDTSHALITFHSTSLRQVMVLEAVGNGYHLIPWKKWRKENTLVARYRILTREPAEGEAALPKDGPPTLEGLCAALEGMAEHIGKGFDFVGLVGFLRLFFMRSKRRIKNPWHNSKQLFCSEAVALFLQKAGLEGFAAPNEIRPDMLLALVRKRNDIYALHEETEGLTKAGEDAFAQPSAAKAAEPLT